MKKLIEEKIRKKGLRMTHARRHILNILEKSQKPMTALDVEHAFAKGDVPNRVTVYRQLHTLVREGVVAQTDSLDRAEKYEMKSTHHHHFVCNRCGDSTCLDESLSEQFVREMLQRLKKQKLFVSSHSITFSGMCNLCHNK